MSVENSKRNANYKAQEYISPTRFPTSEDQDLQLSEVSAGNRTDRVLIYCTDNNKVESENVMFLI